MNTFQIKLIAIVTMLIDHLGLFLFPQFLVFRIIGRIAFPLFAWLIANGAYHTHDISKYLQRLYFFALLSQFPFLFANRIVDPQFSDLNVICTLFFGLGAIFFIQKTRNWVYRIIVIAIAVLLAQTLHTDYGGYGVCVIVGFYLFFNNFKRLAIAQGGLFLLWYLFSPQLVVYEVVGLVSLLFIKLYNNQPGPQAKYLFYLVYPVQYVVYGCILLWVLQTIH